MKKISVFLIMVLMASSGCAMEIEKEGLSLPLASGEGFININLTYHFMQWWLDFQQSKPKAKPNLFALHQACHVGNLDQVRKRIEAGSSLHDKDEDGDAPIHKAVKRGFTKVVRCLLENGAKIDAKDRNGKTPIDIINENESYKQRTMKFDTIKDFDTGFTEMVYVLVEKGASLNVQNEQKRTILNTLISLPMETDMKKQKRQECIELLLTSDPKIFNKNKNEPELLDSDLARNQPKIVQLLLSHT